MIVLVAMFVSGCGTKAIYATDYCLVAEPITWKEGDEDTLLRKVEKHNDLFYEICGDK